jgi:hypothetical protein
MTLTFGKREMKYPGPYLGDLKDSTDLINDTESLRARLTEDGYLLLRGLLERDLVLEARRQMLTVMDSYGELEPGRPLMDGVVSLQPRGSFRGGSNELTECPAFQQVVGGERIMSFFSRLRGGPAVTYDYKWLRVVPPGQNTGAHYDIVYMGRGTKNVLTCWIPLGDVSLEMGPLAILEGSHHFERVKETYGQMDVDRDNVAGWFTTDPLEMIERYGGRWLTSTFQAGDALIFGMFTMHGSLNNMSDRFRLSSDTRYQLADEPIDERWVGRKPLGHYAWGKTPQVSMEEARAKWGV